MQANHRESLRLLRATLFAAIVLPLILFIYACWLDYETVHEVSDKHIERTKDVVNEHALKVFEAVDRAIAEIAEIVRDMRDDEIAAKEPQLHERLRRIVDASSQMKSLWIFDRAGRALVNSISFPVDNTDFSDRDYFSAHVASEVGTYVGTVLRPRAPYTGAAFFGVSRRRISADGSFTGVIQASVLPDYFEGFYEKLSRDPGAYASLVHQNGDLLARYPQLDRNTRLAKNGPLYQAMLGQPSDGKVTLVSAIDGEGRTVSYRKLSGFPVFVLAGLSSQAIADQWLTLVRRKLLFGIPATAALIFIVWLALRRTEGFYGEAAARQAAEDALRQSQRLEALGQLTGGVAHDFNNLLMVVGGSVARLKSHISDQRATRSIAMIEEAVQKGTSLTRQLLTFSRRQSLSPKVIDLVTCVQNFSDVLRQSLRGNIRLSVSLPVEVVAIHVDRNELEIALLNLVLNSRDAMPEGGEVRIAVGVEHNSNGTDQRCATIRVSDTGTGIPEDIREHIFEPYYTTKSLDKGTGLGLSQVYGFAKQSGGEISFTTKPGNGTTFTLSLPLTAEALEQPSQAASEKRQRAGMRVLLVEDNANVLTVAIDYLEQCGCSVVPAPSAEAAIAVLDHDPNFDVMFSDIVMPGMSGLELAHWVRERHPRLQIILATGYSDNASSALSEGYTLLNKPYSLDALKDALAAARPQSTAA